MGHVPVVFGEFGTWFNFCRDEEDPARRALGPTFSEQFLDSMYEGFEKLGLSRMQWVFAPDTDAVHGEWYDQEDFSIQGPADPVDGVRRWRGESAWARPYARALAGRLVDTHFWSIHHDFAPQHQSGVVDPVREFEVRYQRKEVAAPSEIVVPALQYPDAEGFYVWVSDGRCSFDPETRILYHHPTEDAPGTIHTVRIRPPLPGYEPEGWQYYFRGASVLEGTAGRL
jgi:hypothetical protein